MPLSHDQPDNAARVRALGAGDRVMPGQFRTRRVAKVLSRLLESAQVKANCEHTARRCAAQDAIADTTTLIEAAAVARSTMTTSA